MRVAARDTTALAFGSAVNGLLAYLLFSLGTRSLGPSEAAPVSVLWTYWSFTAAAVTFPLQHWIARSVAAHGGEGAVRRALPRLALVVLAVSVLGGALAWFTRGPLFGRDDAIFPLLVAAVTVGAGFVGVVRGGLSARHRFGAVAVVLVAENAVRCLAAAALIVLDAESAAGFGLCLAAGGLVVLLWPSSFRFTADRVRAAESPLRFLTGASSGQLLGQTVLTGGPVLLAFAGGPATGVTALFAGLALFRAPYILGLGLIAPVTGRLAALSVRGEHAALARLRLLALAGSVLAVVVAAGIGALAGPAMVRLVFGEQVRLPTLASTLVAVGSALALANLFWTVLALARGRSGPIAWSWSGAVLAAAVIMAAAVPVEPLTRTCWAFLTAEGVAFAALLVADVRGSDREPSPPAYPHGLVVPGDSAEGASESSSR